MRYAELDRAIILWEKGSVTAATTKVMTIQSSLYGESGLRDVIMRSLGKDRATEHEHRLDTLRKRIQGIGTETIPDESMLKNEAAALVENLMKDVEKMPAP